MNPPCIALQLLKETSNPVFSQEHYAEVCAVTALREEGFLDFIRIGKSSWY
jgi:hypothetical protein